MASLPRLPLATLRLRKIRLRQTVKRTSSPMCLPARTQGVVDFGHGERGYHGLVAQCARSSLLCSRFSIRPCIQKGYIPELIIILKPQSLIPHLLARGIYNGHHHSSNNAPRRPLRVLLCEFQAYNHSNVFFHSLYQSLVFVRRGVSATLSLPYINPEPLSNARKEVF